MTGFAADTAPCSSTLRERVWLFDVSINDTDAKEDIEIESAMIHAIDRLLGI